jgi:hypothetical protein
MVINRTRTKGVFAVGSLILALCGCSVASDVGSAASSSATPTTVEDNSATETEAASPDPAAAESVAPVPAPIYESMDDLPLDLSSADGVCSSVPGLEDLAYDSIIDVSDLQIGYQGAGADSMVCVYEQTGDFNRSINFSYLTQAGLCKDLIGASANPGNEYQPWTAIPDTVFTDSSLVECIEKDGVATYYRLRALDDSGFMESVVTETVLRESLLKAKSAEARFPELTAAATYIAQHPGEF